MPLFYDLINNGTSYQIGVGSCEVGAVTIPSYYLGLPVRRIADNAFQNCSTLTSVTIPFFNNIDYIGSSAFQNCIGLLSFNFNAFAGQVVNLGTSIFYNCTNLASVNIANIATTSIPDNMFYNCTKLNNFTFPNSVTNVGNSAFVQCASLVELNFSTNLQTIGPYAFLNCTSLKTVKLPNSVTEVAVAGFGQCSNLTNLSLSNNMTYIRGTTFANCTRLRNVYIPEGIKYIENAGFSNTDLISITIPKSVLSIGSNGFNPCFKLVRANFLGNFPSLVTTGPSYAYSFGNNASDFKFYREKYFVNGWPNSINGFPVVLLSENIINSGGNGKLIGYKI